MSTGKAILIGLLVGVIVFRDPQIITQVANTIVSLLTGGHG